jgi:hypothetical protein
MIETDQGTLTPQVGRCCVNRENRGLFTGFWRSTLDFGSYCPLDTGTRFLTESAASRNRFGVGSVDSTLVDSAPTDSLLVPRSLTVTVPSRCSAPLVDHGIH